MLQSPAPRGHSRRQSSNSRSSLVTVLPLDKSRSPSRSRSRLSSGQQGVWNGHNAGDIPTVETQKRARSASTKRSSTANKRMDGYNAEVASNSAMTSLPPQPSSTKEHRRRSSLSTRLPSLAAMTGMARRAPSPAKKKRPAELPVKPANGDYHGTRNATLAPSDMLPRGGGTFFTLDSPMFLPSDVSEPPRTPLLSEAQISKESSTQGRPPQPGTRFRPPHDWSPDNNRQLHSRGSTNASSDRQNLSSRGGESQSSGNSRSLRIRAPLGSPPQMQQRIRNSPSKSREQFHSHTLSSGTSEGGSQGSPRRRAKSSRDGDKDRKKTMLSSALHRAQEAVEMDNSHDFAGALNAYQEACDYLMEVASRSSRDVDKDKLKDIRNQYIVRIMEIQQLEKGDSTAHRSSKSTGSATTSGGEVQVRPSIDDSFDGLETAPIETARLTRIIDAAKLQSGGTGDIDHDTQASRSYTTQTLLSPPQGDDIVPAPLSPRRPPPQPPSRHEPQRLPSEDTRATESRDNHEVDPQPGTPTSWLDGNEDAGGASSPSPQQSVSSLNQMYRRHLRSHSTSTEADFDAALDAAVEAAYDDGYLGTREADKPALKQRLSQISRNGSILSNDAYLAGKMDRYLAHRRSQSSKSRLSRGSLSQNMPARDEVADLDSDEEADRILSHAQTSLAEVVATNSQSRSGFPRESNSSSSSSGRTWGSSAASSLNTVGTSLTTVDENSHSTRSKQLHGLGHPPPAPPPTQALPIPPRRSSGNFNVKQASSGEKPATLQDRRQSSRKGKPLKIETAAAASAAEHRPAEHAKPEKTQGPESNAPLVPPKTAPGALEPSVGQASTTQHGAPLRPPAAARQISSPFPTPFQATFLDFSGSSIVSPSETNLTSAVSNDGSMGLRASPYPMSPGESLFKPLNEGALQRNNDSSLSLRSKGLLTPGSELDFRSPASPLTGSFSALSPSHAVGFHEEKGKGLGAQPRPLEPCPESQLLRPYWLLRCVYQTIAHPDGGYLTTKLCIPRKAWKTEGVKLKHVDDKIASCDLLSAALLKLAAIDDRDADAVLEEMECLESIVSQVQTSLSKKLGSDVGAQGISNLFKEAPASVTSPSDTLSRQESSIDQAGNTNSTGSGKSSSKGYFSFGRKLRSKPSDTALAKSYTSVRKHVSGEGLKMSTVPMTSSLQLPSNRGAKKDGRPVTPSGEVKIDGPYANYTSALSKLCDAVQVLDKISRQVEDPGLMRSSKTHVGLEISSKHASEFFGLYICRFVLQDITMLAEKHVKKAVEWTLQ